MNQPIKNMLRRPIFRLFAAEEPPVLISNHNQLCQVKLNKPKALNSLDLPMIKILQNALFQWNSDPEVSAAYFLGAGNKAFCAGGDIRTLYEAKHGSHEPSVLKDFFWYEYILDYGLAKMNPVQICEYDGIVMGGGVGISVHAPLRIATEEAVFAMPETAIGFFPDVGGSYFLSRLPNSLGLYLGVTGARISGPQLVQAGVATHFVPKEKLPELKEYLISEMTSKRTVQEIKDMVEKYSEEITEPLAELDNIQRCFSEVTSIEHIYHKLDEDQTEWAEKKLATFEKLSPLSLKIVFEQVKRGKELSLEEVFKMEYRLSQNFMNDTDFFEGVRANLVDKDKNPQWKHKSVFEVPDEEVNKYFEKANSSDKDLEVVEELKLLQNSNI